MIVARPGPKISVVIPAHNEAENLPKLLEEISAAEQSMAVPFEILVVDDASSDSTAAVLESLMPRYPRLRILPMVRQSGQSAALSAGFDNAEGEIVVTIDADLQNDPADIPKLVAELTHADVAVGWRRDRKDPWSKKIISKVANAVRNWATAESVRDTGCGLKAFKRECVDKIHRFDGMHRFFPTLVKMHGYQVVEVPVHHRPRESGKTHYNIFNRSLRPMADLFAVRWLQRRTLRYRLMEERVLVPR
ncbi:MAG: glycosyltransferase family 2 protein [Planctomycetota bacterium]